MSEVLVSWPTLISTQIMEDGPVVTVNTSASHAWVVELLNGNTQLCVRQGRKECRIELTPEAAAHLAKRLTAKTTSKTGAA